MAKSSAGASLLRDVTRDFPEAAHCDALFEVRSEVSGLHAFIALHDLSRGAGYGGIRRRVYGSVVEAVHEVVGLAEHMTLKTAFAGLRAGGAKAVILDRPGIDREKAYECLGHAIEALGGDFVAGPDVGTSDSELAALRHSSDHVTGPDAHPAQSAATGVVLACREALAFVGAPAVSRSVVTGVGAVGSLVARGLAALGHDLALADLDHARAVALADELRARAVEAGEAIYAECDLLSPCGIGPVITERRLTSGARFRARVICGSANQQLEEETLAHELAERGVLYVPDFAVNAGAVIEGVMRRQAAPGTDPSQAIHEAIARIGPRLRDLLRVARDADMTPLEAALMQIDAEGD